MTPVSHYSLCPQVWTRLWRDSMMGRPVETTRFAGAAHPSHGRRSALADAGRVAITREYQPCRSGVRRARRRQHQMALRPRGALQLRRAGPGQDVHDSHDPSHRCRRHSRPRRRIGLRQGHRRAGTWPDQCRRHPGLGTPHAHRGHGRHLLGGLKNPDAARDLRARQPDHGVAITITVGSVTRVSPARSARHR